ncbi:MAG: TusE/DsrC/DsvC family sulfur relay protein [Gammaproteobacteria bacterium]|nr:TusE/DsrC/DsvC family sulfur relay protein [Gammaproteobacteria bacterium]MCP5135360.1 TusE/DsrC/DsvC family sulfur relay protein [Gammaproteobacteria bacterium]
MICVHVVMRHTGEPFKRVPVRFEFDTGECLEAQTDRIGRACVDAPAGSGKIVIDGRERYHGLLTGEIELELWSLLEPENPSLGAVGGLGGSVAYPNMQTRELMVAGRTILTDSEGYLVDPGEWSEDFVRALAQSDELDLSEEHWEVIRYLRAFFERHQRQAAVRDMVKHFRARWDRERGSSPYLHRLFPRGGPQKQGNRLAGLLRTKGEH